MRTANPALTPAVFTKEVRRAGTERMTIGGTVNKTFILLLLLMPTAIWSWNASMPQSYGGYEFAPTFVPTPLLWIGVFGSFVVAMITIFKKTWAPITAPIYALLEGLSLGAISAGFELKYPGIVMQAVAGTFGTLFALLAAYRSGLIRATENFKLGIVAATGGIAVLYLINIVMGFFGSSIPMIHESTPLGIGFSVVVVAIAAFNLVLDFDFIENGEAAGAPKYMEWYAGFGLLVTLVWLYLEILRLLAKTQRRK